MAWVWWLSAPVVATVLASLWAWLRARPAPEPTTRQAMQRHRDYLDALAATPRSAGGPAASAPGEGTDGSRGTAA